MHSEYFTAIASADADAPGLEQPEPEQPEIDRFDEAPVDAPPHAANPTEAVTRAASSAPGCRRRSSMPTPYIDHQPVDNRHIRPPAMTIGHSSPQRVRLF
jgi:hypothetical protein